MGGMGINGSSALYKAREIFPGAGGMCPFLSRHKEMSAFLAKSENIAWKQAGMCYFLLLVQKKVTKENDTASDAGGGCPSNARAA